MRRLILTMNRILRAPYRSVACRGIFLLVIIWKTTIGISMVVVSLAVVIPVVLKLVV